jgi:hypothetical protein
MKHERLVRPIADNPRCYERLDGKAFFSEIQTLMGSRPATAKSSKAKTLTAPATETKAASPQPDATSATEPPKTRPAVYISEVHGPLVPAPRKPAKRSAKR